MNFPVSDLNKQFESRVRLGVMSVLMVNEWADFNSLKELLSITDGNLASHLKALESADYIQVSKRFVGRKPQTRYRATAAGRKAFKDHIDTLEAIIKAQAKK